MNLRLRHRPGRFAAALAAAAALAGSAAGSGAAAGNVLPTLYVTYTMNCTFAITNDAGAPVTSIAPGSYQILITSPVSFAAVDLSGVFDMTACKGSVLFQLTGPGVSVQSTLTDGDGDHDLQQATFQPGATYVAVDNNQPSVARASFTTLTSGSPSSPAAPGGAGSGSKGQTSTDLVGSKSSSASSGSTSTPLRGALGAAVSAAGKLTLTFKGKAVTTLRSGRYTLTVTDQSAKSGFIIQEIHKSATTVTAVPFTGRKTATLDLKAGQWFFYPTFVGAKTYFVVTS